MPPSDGQVLFKGKDIATLPTDEAREAKLKVQMIFQDPYASLNPRLRVEEIVGEAPRVHGLVPRGGFDEYLDAQLRRAAQTALDRRNRQLSSPSITRTRCRSCDVVSMRNRGFSKSIVITA